MSKMPSGHENKSILFGLVDFKGESPFPKKRQNGSGFEGKPKRSHSSGFFLRKAQPGGPRGQSTPTLHQTYRPARCKPTPRVGGQLSGKQWHNQEAKQRKAKIQAKNAQKHTEATQSKPANKHTSKQAKPNQTEKHKEITNNQRNKQSHTHKTNKQTNHTHNPHTRTHARTHARARARKQGRNSRLVRALHLAMCLVHLR